MTEANDTTAGIDPSELSYEAARDELVDVVRQLETGGSSLEQSLALWERGEALASRCQLWLDGAKERLAKAQQAHANPAANGEEPS
ncbi:exodeoxyribonuclease VII small subunit [Saxibacter everestensis]|uniref:Exodeoxyribonuclease 7 small subunit n=1 Tax=Saxibacter everestensis TaxID=2909229 RepID=A0ABY8QQH0_9MICO|nr:exodeoxyribonuclease VII small subunit [Brevibacteriaceae bacterium ZFBP1038]